MVWRKLFSLFTMNGKSGYRSRRRVMKIGGREVRWFCMSGAKVFAFQFFACFHFVVFGLSLWVCHWVTGNCLMFVARGLRVGGFCFDNFNFGLHHVACRSCVRRRLLCASDLALLGNDLPKQSVCAKESTTASYDVVPGRRRLRDCGW